MKKLYLAAVFGLAVMSIARGVAAQDAAAWPSQPVKIVVPWAAGGTVDFTARQLAQSLGVQTGKPFIVENKPGAGGTIGTNYVAKAAPDGYTALLFESSYAMLPGLYEKLPWDQARDLAPVGAAISTPMALVVPERSPFNSVRDLIAYARSHPGKLNFGSGGYGSSPHMTAELFKRDAGIDIAHIPYKGGGEALLGVMADSADLLFTAVPTALPQRGQGKIKILAVSSARRVAALPDVPTVAESGLPGFAVDNWYGVAMPRGTDPAIVSRMSALIHKALADPALVERFAQQGAEVTPSSPEAFGKVVRDETRRWTEVSHAAGIKPQ
ncbi:lipoprotein [Bordetella ansorpii]|uniref:Lipoprotein n=1 Tax=Bordetella ansorpii TaxID=288768 RepID=A0A157Q881_9BORD|nr:tripartite tricarboxylate transporter substrate binding protein [Bordetella ansorpii]SAI42135.1 lipoprotein [Bordetella ansorpii]